MLPTLPAHPLDRLIDTVRRRWYEGGGLTRHIQLVTAPYLHVAPSGAWAHATISKTLTAGRTPADGVRAASALVTAELPLRNWAASAASATMRLRVLSASGKEVAAVSSAPTGVPAMGRTSLVANVSLDSPELWSVARPYLYVLAFSLHDPKDVELDSVNVTLGLKVAMFDASSGLRLNGQAVKLRGFCDHDNWGGVGSAVADRINLFRAQGLRAVGANAWRTAHNPPPIARLDYMDRLGVLAMDENRDYGGHKGQGGITDESVANELVDIADMVTRDRHHASILLWSLCNEVGCNNESAAAAFRSAVYGADATHPITQNHLGDGTHPLSAASLDVQGLSHKHTEEFVAFHKANPHKPTVASECCSCLSQRGEDYDACPKPRDCKGSECHRWCGGKTGSEDLTHNGTFYNNEISECTATQVNISDAPRYIAGTFIWSGFDYLGEARGWPQTAKPRGTVGDVAGFVKESFWWLRSWWLSRIPLSDAGRPPLADTRTTFIVDTWKHGKRADGSPLPSTRSIHVYTDATRLALELNGKRVAGPIAVPAFGNAQFSVRFAPGNLTAVALSASGGILDTHTVMTPNAGASLRLSVDAPSPATGTGRALVADAQDVALVRAEVIDATGVRAADAADLITFVVASGEGRLWATHSGDPAADTYEPPHGASRRAYHGLARAIVVSTTDRATPASRRRRLRQITTELGQGHSRVTDPDAEPALGPPAPIVVTASAPGLGTATLSIPVTTDLAELPLAVASRAAEATRLNGFA